MPTYISLIRGINVGGHKKLKMDELRKAVEALGFAQVRTYVQSGNLVFQAPKQATAAVSKKIEAVILKKFGYEVSVITKTPEELKAAIESNPFLKGKAVAEERLYVTFLSGCPEPANVKRLDAVSSGADEYRWQDNVIYFHLPNGAGNSKLATAPFEKWFSVRATTRNWRTVNNLHQMATEHG
jgi:uncharacterized protein (DUF1697 family)